MIDGRRRGVTRGYVGGLIFAAAILAFALMLAVWGIVSYLAGGQPISTPDKSLVTATLLVLLCLAGLVWGLWSQAIALLRGKRSPSWGHILITSVGGYLLWCLGGILAGLAIEDTWVSIYAVTLGLLWGVASLVFWAVLMRRVYTDRPTPRWPWERRGELGPDWANTDNDPWRDPDDKPGDSEDEAR